MLTGTPASVRFGYGFNRPVAIGGPAKAPCSRGFLPPVTASLLLANLAMFFKPGGVPRLEVCLSSYCVVEKQEYAR
eukprot:gene21085-27968_t